MPIRLQVGLGALLLACSASTGAPSGSAQGGANNQGGVAAGGAAGLGGSVASGGQSRIGFGGASGQAGAASLGGGGPGRDPNTSEEAEKFPR